MKCGRISPEISPMSSVGTGEENCWKDTVQKEYDTNHPCFFFQSADMDRGLDPTVCVHG